MYTRDNQKFVAFLLRRGAASHNFGKCVQNVCKGFCRTPRALIEYLLNQRGKLEKQNSFISEALNHWLTRETDK